MPRLVHKLPAYSRHRYKTASGEIKVLAKVKYKDKVTYLGEYGTKASKDAYARFIANLSKADSDDASPRSAAPMREPLKVKELVLRYDKFAETYYRLDSKPTSELDVIRWALRPLVEEFGETLADDFDSLRLEELQERLTVRGPRGKMRSRAAINRITMVIRRCFRWAQKKKLVAPGVWGDLKSVDLLKKNRTKARECKPVKPVSDEVIEQTLPELSAMLAAMVRFQRATGARPGEVVALSRGAIDRKDETLWEYRPAHHKTAHHGKDRVVFINARAIEILKPWLANAEDGPILSLKGDRPIFPITTDGYRRAITRACKRAKVTEWAPNQLRHTFATEARSKVGLEAAQVLLGHTRADVTQMYAETDVSKAREAARAIG